MATPRVAIQTREVRHELGPEGIEVEVADQVPEVGVCLDDEGLVAVLEEMAVPAMAPVVRLGVAGEEPAHELGEPLGATPEQQVRVVGQEGPGIDRGPGRRGDRAQAGHESLPILPIGHDLPPLDPAEDDVVQGPRGIQPCLSWQARPGPPS